MVISGSKSFQQWVKIFVLCEKLEFPALKKLDKFILSSFVGPFFVTFLIAIFVLMMQYLWVYVDDIIGKGAGLFMLIELISYLTVSLIPMALPIAMLISSVMLMGNLAERYELSSMKSAGISLMRVMAPLMFAAVGVALFSFLCSDSLIPISNLKFKSRLYDIRKQRPTLSIEEGLFNDDFQNFVIRVGKKGSDNKSVEEVLIYDHSASNEGRLTQIVADKGKMYTSNGGKYFIMDLFDGDQYFELKPDYKGGNRNYPFVRTSFKEWSKVFDLGAFEIQRTDEELFKTHHTMLSTSQLAAAVDSIDVEYVRRKDEFENYVNRFFEILAPAEEVALVDTNQVAGELVIERQTPGTQPFQQITTDLSNKKSILELFSISQQIEMVERAKTLARSVLSQAESTTQSLLKTKEKKVKHVFELHSKFSLAMACFIFLFIGAPMGAIVRKGGFGYPILISIIFFMIFIILTIMCKKLAESAALPAALAAWMPCIVLFPVGMLLTVKAMNDSKLMNVDKWWPIVLGWFSKKKK